MLDMSGILFTQRDGKVFGMFPFVACQLYRFMAAKQVVVFHEKNVILKLESCYYRTTYRIGIVLK